MDLVDATAQALRRHLPFSGMEAGAVRRLAAQLRLAYVPREGEVLAEGADVDRLWIVKQGVVRGEPAPELRGEKLVGVTHGAGEMFPIGAAVGRRPSAYRYVAASDLFAWELPLAAFHEAVAASPELQQFCTGHLAALLDNARRAMRGRAAETLSDEGRMLQPLQRFARADVVHCPPATPIGEVLRRMSDLRVGSMIVTDEAGRPAGIFTLPDVLSRVALRAPDLSGPISSVMTPSPIVLPLEAPLHAAALAMARHRIRHVILVDGAGKLAGVVSERDLFSLQRVGLRRTADRVREARHREELAEAAGDVRTLAGVLLAQSAGAEQVMQIIGALNDAIVERATEVAASRAGLAGAWCWIALGSEGRGEQTLATDQDNALILADPADKPAALAFANEVNETLAACGFPLCPGDIMARNPKWCLTLEEWLAAFQGWIRHPHPEALLQAAIFFDLRPLAGDAELGLRLVRGLHERIAGQDAFLRAMAANAAQVKVPLGLLGDFDTEATASGRQAVDLKKFGVRPFVDAARLWSLAHGIAHTSTAERLRGAVRAGVLPEDEGHAAVEGFFFVQALRLRHQQFDRPPPGEGNFVEPEALNALDRRVLKEVFRVSAKLAARLRLDYAL